MGINTLSKIERQQRTVDVDDLVALASALGVEAVQLLLPAIPDWAGTLARHLERIQDFESERNQFLGAATAAREKRDHEIERAKAVARKAGELDLVEQAIREGWGFDYFVQQYREVAISEDSLPVGKPWEVYVHETVESLKYGLAIEEDD